MSLGGHCGQVGYIGGVVGKLVAWVRSEWRWWCDARELVRQVRSLGTLTNRELDELLD
jgi:hypothetical protein